MNKLIEAARRSICHNEIVTVEIDRREWPESVGQFDEIEYSVLEDESWDVWGKYQGEDFRIRVSISKFWG